MSVGGAIDKRSKINHEEVKEHYRSKSGAHHRIGDAQPIGIALFAEKDRVDRVAALAFHLAVQLHVAVLAPIAFDMEGFVHRDHSNTLLLSLHRDDTLGALGTARSKLVVEARYAVLLVVLVYRKRNSVQNFLAGGAGEATHMVRAAASPKKLVGNGLSALCTLVERVLVAGLADRIVVDIVERGTRQLLLTAFTVEACHMEYLIKSRASGFVDRDLAFACNANIVILHYVRPVDRCASGRSVG